MGVRLPRGIDHALLVRRQDLAEGSALRCGGGVRHIGGQARTVAVGTLPANAFGLHDMHGNVQEWVNDWYDEYYYFDAPPDDPPGPLTGTMKVVRGGCFTMFGSDCRSAARRQHSPTGASNTVGFRVVLEVGR